MTLNHFKTLKLNTLHTILLAKISIVVHILTEDLI